MSLSIEQQVAQNLLAIKAVFLSPNEPFTWASGIKSPIYCDNRLTMSFPKVRRLIAKGLAEKIKKQFPEVEVIAGTATAGIPHAAWVAEILDLPMVYIRSKAKDHGKGNQIEGQITPGQKMVVNKQYPHIAFAHHDLVDSDEDYEAFLRRVKRFLELFENKKDKIL